MTISRRACIGDTYAAFTIVAQDNYDSLRDALQVHYRTMSSFSGRKLWLSRKNGSGRMANFTWAISENLSLIASGDCEDLARLESKIWSVQDLGTQRWNMNERSQKVFLTSILFHKSEKLV